MIKYCSVCRDSVESEGHTHPEKECQVCHQTKKLAEFPEHASSIDKHRHTCILCVEQEKAQQKTRHRDYRVQAAQQRIERQAKREQENALFHAYGYRWKKEMVDPRDDWASHDDQGKAWVLHTPTGAQISTQEALQEIARLQVHRPGHPSTLWADDVLSLAHPLVLILDTETTGFDEHAEIVEIALLDKYGEVYLNTLIQCQQEAIPQEAMRVHRIHKSMLRNAPTFSEVWSGLVPLLSSHEIVIYNAEYDLRLLRQTAKRHNLELPKMRVHCLMQQYSSYVGQASALSSGYRSMKLAAACFHFEIEQTTAHRALADAQASLEVLHKLAARACPILIEEA